MHHAALSALDLNSPGTYLHRSLMEISLANLIVIAVMVVPFGAALLIRCPDRAAAELPPADAVQDPALAAAAPLEGDERRWRPGCGPFNAVGIGAIGNAMNFGQMFMWHIVLMPLALIAIVGAHILMVRVRSVSHPLPAQRALDSDLLAQRQFIPGLRDIPRAVPVYWLIWRSWYSTRDAAEQPPQTAQPAEAPQRS
ncbi:MAG: hypothetical protein ACRDOK_19475 [Streptosporangiaceae bacterium]